MTRAAATKLAILVLAMVPASGQLNNQVAGHEVSCPVPEVRADITTSIPKPWWTTPQIGRLQSTQIQVIGGEKTLVCRYSAYGTLVSVMRKFPEGARDCRAAGNHFICR